MSAAVPRRPAGTAPAGKAGPEQLTLIARPPTRPREELRVAQQGLCAGCSAALPTGGRSFWDLDGTRLAALVCGRCTRRRPVLTTPAPVTTVSSLLRLRLTLGPHLDFPRTVFEAERAALTYARWDDLRRPTQALWIAQGGKCAMAFAGFGSDDHDMTSPVLDHDHVAGLVRGLLCQSCNCIEGKGARRRSVEAWRSYRGHPPAQQLLVTRGMHYDDLTKWDRDAYRRAHQARRRAA